MRKFKDHPFSYADDRLSGKTVPQPSAAPTFGAPRVGGGILENNRKGYGGNRVGAGYRDEGHGGRPGRSRNDDLGDMKSHRIVVHLSISGSYDL